MTQKSRNTCTWICDDGWCHLSNVQNPYDIPLASLTGILIKFYYRQYNPPISATTRAQGELITASSSDIKLARPDPWDSNHSADCSSETEAFCPMTWFHREELGTVTTVVPKCGFANTVFFSKDMGGKIDDWEGFILIYWYAFKIRDVKMNKSCLFVLGFEKFLTQNVSPQTSHETWLQYWLSLCWKWPIPTVSNPFGLMGWWDRSLFNSHRFGRGFFLT